MHMQIIWNSLNNVFWQYTGYVSIWLIFLLWFYSYALVYFSWKWGGRGGGVCVLWTWGPPWSGMYGSWIYSYLIMQSVPIIITTIIVSLNPKVYLIQHYVMKFVSDLQKVDGFIRVLQYPLPPWYNWNIVESDVKHQTPNPSLETFFHFLTIIFKFLLKLADINLNCRWLYISNVSQHNAMFMFLVQ